MRFVHLINVVLWFANAILWAAISPTHFWLFWAVVAAGDLIYVRYMDKEQLWTRH